MNAGSRRPTRAAITSRRALLVAIATLAVWAILAGLARMGVSVGKFSAAAPIHGPLIVLGVFQGVIALERAVALGRAWGFAAPALAFAGGALALAGFALAPWVLVAASALMVALNAAVIARQSALFTWLMLLGSLLLLVGAIAWARDTPIAQVVPTWMAFFVLTILAERLELSRLVRTPRAATAGVLILSGLLALCALAALAEVTDAARAFGVPLALTGAWILRFDAARRTARQPGLPRFAAVGVLAGAAWLVLAGLLLTEAGLPPAGPRYDATLHAVMVGFVLGLVFAHAPIILPAVARVRVTFHRALYAPLGLLHATLALRLTGDLLGVASLRQAGGIGNALSLLLFALTIVVGNRRTP